MTRILPGRGICGAAAMGWKLVLIWSGDHACRSASGVARGKDRITGLRGDNSFWCSAMGSSFIFIVNNLYVIYSSSNSHEDASLTPAPVFAWVGREGASLAIICFANSRSEIGGRAAAAVAGALSNEGLGTALYDCLERFAPETRSHSARDMDVRNPVCGRQFIEETRALARNHEHLVIDLSGAGDQIAAIAFAMADLVLVPFLPHRKDAAPFVRTIELLDILSSHRSQPLRRAVFLASHDSISPRVHLEISGQLIRRGLATFPVSFQPPPEPVSQTNNAQCMVRTDVAAEPPASFPKAEITRFAQYALSAALHPNHTATARVVAARR